jgi:short subunit dehydrogenase-like uncharacterized protein
VNGGADAIVLFGGTGYTGGLIARELHVRDIPFTIASREEARGQALRDRLGSTAPVVVADVTDRASFIGALDRAAVVINCVGPYNLFGAALITECRRRELVYVDLCGEQDFVRRSMEDAVDDGPSTILHSIAFESTLADLLAAGMVAVGQSCASICSYYSFAASRPSPGTHLTMKASRHFPTYRVTAGRLEKAEPLSFEDRGGFGDGLSGIAAFMPYPEVLFFWRRYRPREASSFLLMGASEAALARAARTSPAADLPSIVDQHRRRRREGPSDAERKRQAFTLTVRSVQETGEEQVRQIAGRDMYRVSALLVIHLVEFLSAGATLPKGVLAPAELPVWTGLWTRLQEQGLIVIPGEAG